MKVQKKKELIQIILFNFNFIHGFKKKIYVYIFVYFLKFISYTKMSQKKKKKFKDDKN